MSTIFPALYFEIVSHWIWSSLSGLTPGIVLPSHSQCWNYKHVLLSSSFLWGCWGPGLRFSRLHNQLFTRWVISPAFSRHILLEPENFGKNRKYISIKEQTKNKTKTKKQQKPIILQHLHHKCHNISKPYLFAFLLYTFLKNKSCSSQ